MKTNKKELKGEIRKLKRMIAGACLQCVCYQPKEVLRCEIQSCPLFAAKPASSAGLYTLAKNNRKAEAKNRGI
jgi:hypothetical protein